MINNSDDSTLLVAVLVLVVLSILLALNNNNLRKRRGNKRTSYDSTNSRDSILITTSRSLDETMNIKNVHMPAPSNRDALTSTDTAPLLSTKYDADSAALSKLIHEGIPDRIIPPATEIDINQAKNLEAGSPMLLPTVTMSQKEILNQHNISIRTDIVSFRSNGMPTFNFAFANANRKTCRIFFDKITINGYIIAAGIELDISLNPKESLLSGLPIKSESIQLYQIKQINRLEISVGIVVGGTAYSDADIFRIEVPVHTLSGTDTLEELPGAFIYKNNGVQFSFLGQEKGPTYKPVSFVFLAKNDTDQLLFVRPIKPVLNGYLVQGDFCWDGKLLPGTCTAIRLGFLEDEISQYASGGIKTVQCAFCIRNIATKTESYTEKISVQ